MLHHCRAVARGAKSPFMIGDMPFGSYETSPKDALKNAIRLIKEGNMEVLYEYWIELIYYLFIHAIILIRVLN
jgi:ketopantoate hydroxymethyltransferase